MYFDSKHKQDCSGCTACMNACPTTAISMREDEEGFLYPSINDEICINCGLCRKVCSWEHPKYDGDEKPTVLASILKNKEERQRSTSGGVFYAVAEWIISQGGVVYGAAFDENFQLHHIGVYTIDGLQKLRGSKYLQSNLGTVFKDIERELKTGRWCYFTGTGCQVAGLRAFLRKDYPSLITSDIVCHGVPSQKLFDEHITYLEEKYYDKVVSYQFRDCQKGKGGETVNFAHRKTIKKPGYVLSPYLYSFMYGLTHRYSCYGCRFAQLPRQGDITLADFWGIEYIYPKFDRSNGASLLLLNTQKGRDLWDKIKGNCTFEVSNVRDASKHNGNLVHPSDMPSIRNSVYQEIKHKGYAIVAKELFRPPHYYRLKFIYFLMGFKPIEKLYEIIKKN